MGCHFRTLYLLEWTVLLRQGARQFGILVLFLVITMVLHEV